MTVTPNPEVKKEENRQKRTVRKLTDRVQYSKSWIPALVVSGVVLAATFSIALVSAYQNGVFFVASAILLFSGVLGWVTGMLFSPDDEKEASKFSSLWKGLTVFLSGYVVSKLEPQFKDIPKYVGCLFTLSAVFWVEVFSNMVVFLTAAILVYLLRMYAFDCEGGNIFSPIPEATAGAVKNQGGSGNAETSGSGK